MKKDETSVLEKGIRIVRGSVKEAIVGQMKGEFRFYPGRCGNCWRVPVEMSEPTLWQL